MVAGALTFKAASWTERLPLGQARSPGRRSARPPRRQSGLRGLPRVAIRSVAEWRPQVITSLGHGRIEPRRSPLSRQQPGLKLAWPQQRKIRRGWRRRSPEREENRPICCKKCCKGVYRPRKKARRNWLSRRSLRCRGDRRWTFPNDSTGAALLAQLLTQTLEFPADTFRELGEG